MMRLNEDIVYHKLKNNAQISANGFHNHVQEGQMMLLLFLHQMQGTIMCKINTLYTKLKKEFLLTSQNILQLSIHQQEVYMKKNYFS